MLKKNQLTVFRDLLLIMKSKLKGRVVPWQGHLNSVSNNTGITFLLNKALFELR